MLTKNSLFIAVITFGLLVGAALAEPPGGNAREQGLATALEQVGANDHTDTALSVLDQLAQLNMPADAGQHPTPLVVNHHPPVPDPSHGENGFESRTSGLEQALENIGNDNPGMAQSVLEQLLASPGPPTVEPNLNTNDFQQPTAGTESFTIVANPEPATLILLTVGALALARRRQRP